MVNVTTGPLPPILPPMDPSLLEDDTITVFAPTRATVETRDIYDQICRTITSFDDDDHEGQVQTNPTPIGSNDQIDVVPEVSGAQQNANSTGSFVDNDSVASTDIGALVLRETLRPPQRFIVALSSCVRYLCWILSRARHHRHET